MTADSQYHLDRDSGLLTKKDRAYLLGETEYEDDQQERNRRQYIRDRVRNGVMDFALLFRLERRDREQIFRSLNQTAAVNSSEDAKEFQHMLEGLKAMLWISYFASFTSNVSFNEILEEGIGKAERELTGRELAEIRLWKRYIGGEVEESGPFAESPGQLTEDEQEELRDTLERALSILDNK